ncbi:hypothetical protein [Agrobacterium tumefaciens]|uniref:hypothetical protein n=1 Tax=Agrobacterium tumefaciens TaxID=358 RepID=UPI003BA335F8
MKTLSEILKNEKSSAAIFGQVHRRQRELASVLRVKGVLTYEHATVTDLKDYAFILGFNETLKGWQFQLDTRETGNVSCRENVERRAALEAAGIDNEVQLTINRDATSVAHAVMCETVKDWDTYNALTALPTDDLAKAA